MFAQIAWLLLALAVVGAAVWVLTPKAADDQLNFIDDDDEAQLNDVGVGVLRGTR